MAANGLDRFVAGLGWSGCLSSIVLAASAPGLARMPAVQWSPWLAGLLVLGIPHGALDHRVGADLIGRVEGRPGIGFYAAYVSAAALVILCWFLSPKLASLGFLAIAAAHFGQGDLAWSREAGLVSRTDSIGYRVSFLLARSVVPIALPLLAFPAELSGEAAELTSRLFGRSGWSLASGVADRGLIAVAAIVGLSMVWAVVIGLGGTGEARRLAALDLAETTLLVATFWAVPPVLALGVYFNVWHAPRHVARILRSTPASRALIDSGRPALAFAAFLRQALPMSAGALVLMAGLGLAIGRGMTSVADLGLFALVSLSALTLPHVLVVAWMDRRQGIWSVGSGVRPGEVGRCPRSARSG